MLSDDDLLEDHGLLLLSAGAQAEKQSKLELAVQLYEQCRTRGVAMTQSSSASAA